MLAATETTAIFSGVTVSSRAKKAGCSTLTKTNAGRPAAKAMRAREMASELSLMRAPRSKRTMTMGSGATNRATAAGSREQQGILQSPVEALLGGRIGARPQLARQIRQQNHPESDADHSQGQLVDPVGVIKIGNGPGLP